MLGLFRFSNRGRSTCAVAMGLVCLISYALAPGGAAAQDSATTSTKKFRVSPTLPLTSFYDTPKPLIPGNPGELIRSETINQYSLPYELSALRILYHSRTASGDDVAVSGVVLIPDRKAPAGGWPIIAWAHEFRGSAQQCAPSLMRNLGAGPILAMYANLGYAVVATDYTGLGAASAKSVVDMASNAQDVIDAVAAARRAVPQLGSAWIAFGSYQGAAAAVAVAEGAIGDPNYLGSVAVGDLAGAQHATSYAHFGSDSADQLLATLSAAKILYPDLQLWELLTDQGMQAYNSFAKSCGDLGSGFNESMLKPGWKNDRFLKEYLSRNDPSRKPAHGPVLVISGGGDTHVSAEETEKTVQRMCKEGDRVQFLKYRGVAASDIMGASAADQISWIKARFAGYPPPSNCP